MTVSPTSTPDQLLTHSLKMCENIVDRYDPHRRLSYLQASKLAVAAGIKCSRSWKPEALAYDNFFEMTLKRDVESALRAGNCETYAESCADLIADAVES